MKILLINWAPVSLGTALGGGVNGYVQQLAVELLSRGHELAYLSSGQTYVPDRQGRLPSPTSRRLDNIAGMSVFEIINSPVVSPGPCQHDNPADEVSCPDLEAELLRCVTAIAPDVVHFHNIEGLSAGCLNILTRSPRPWSVLFSLHNYHTVCTQAYLMQQGRTPCRSFEGGHACTTCIQTRPSRDERTHRARLYADRFPAPPVPPAAPPAAPLSQRLRDAIATSPQPPRPVPQAPPIPLPGTPVTPATVRAALPSSPLPSPLPLYRFDPLCPEWQPLSNDATPDPAPALPLSPHGARRRAMIDALNQCDKVLAVSTFVREKFAALGVAPAVLERMPIGTRMAELAAAQPELRLPTPPGPGRPIRLAFLGYHNFYKGLHMFLDALELLTPDYLQRLSLAVHARALADILPRIRRLQPRLHSITTSDGYAYDEVPSLLSGVDLGIVPSVWWDNGPQTVMEFLACGVPVVGARLGGIPDLVRHNDNGLLFQGNDRFDLARTLAGIVRDPSIIQRLRAGVKPPASMTSHAGAMEDQYLACAALRATPPRASLGPKQ